MVLCARARLSLAVMDINDRGPVLNAGNFAMRVTNVGILGNAFFDVGLCFDPSFEYPRGSGHECLRHADLWVGALDETGHGRVSGGPLLEWRPTLDPADHVLVGWRGRPGSRRGIDDDGDGKIDEEIFNGKDDDGDGEVDEDLGFPSDEVLAADYTDDQPAAVNYGYPNGEAHHPLGLSVHQEAYAWAVPGYDAIAGIQYTITNHSGKTMRQVYIGLLADLDSRRSDEAGGHLDDVVVMRSFTRVIPEGYSNILVSGISGFPPYPGFCNTVIQRTIPVVMDSKPGSGLPAVAVVPLAHTIDPLAQLENPVANAAARAPGRDTFRFTIFNQVLPPGQGGAPVLDDGRYAALEGLDPGSPPGLVGDPIVLVSCGPFPSLAPGQSIDFAVALVAGIDPDSVATAMGNAAFLYHGVRRNLLPDSLDTHEWNLGETGLNGHEVCLEPPPGVSFDYDPHCPQKLGASFVSSIPTTLEHYAHGHCIWTDADCDGCTGLNGNETIIPWLDLASIPPVPARHVTPGDHLVTVASDNQPEILLNAGIVGAGGYSFSGYRVYRVSDWHDRQSLLPPPQRWEQVAEFGPDTLNGQTPIQSVTDTTLDLDRIEYGQRHFPIGRYRFVDRKVLNGFDYVYIVTTLAQRMVVVGAGTVVDRIESPAVATIDSLVTPHVSSTVPGTHVWVVPNPYRGSAAWDRPPVPGDPFGRHVDFKGLPRDRCTIKIWTLAGDLVAQLDHDGGSGDGQVRWDLISRNGQDVESGIYLFTVDSRAGHQVGRFVLIR